MDRYLSERIRFAQRTASSLAADFRILSGLFGLVAPQQDIPDYDHLLTAELVPAHSQKVISQLQGMEIDKVIFLTRPMAKDPGAGPYRDVMEQSCAAIGATFELMEI